MFQERFVPTFVVPLIIALASARDSAVATKPVSAAPAVQQPLPRPRPTTIVVLSSKPGSGDVAVKDARITVHFMARDPSGTLIADTERRGMAFTFLMDQPIIEDFWHDAVRGMRTGGERSVMTPASAVGLVVPGDPTITLTIRLVKVVPL